MKSELVFLKAYTELWIKKRADLEAFFQTVWGDLTSLLELEPLHVG